jgi:hypothetical protein
MDVNHIRFQYDQMRRAQADLVSVGGTAVPDAAIAAQVHGTLRSWQAIGCGGSEPYQEQGSKEWYRKHGMRVHSTAVLL